MDADYEVGATGDFEVSLDGRRIFSKKSLGRFPEKGEVESLLRQAMET